MGWLEFTVIIVCGLLGFIVVNAVIDSRRARAERRQKDDHAKKESSGPKKDEDTARTDRNQKRRTGGKENPPRSWWETLNVDQNASPEQIKSAFRKEISKYHPDRVEGLGIELRELADRKAKEVNRAYTLAKEQRRFK
jgi:DnaJ-domain-containing protein 1